MWNGEIGSGRQHHGAPAMSFAAVDSRLCVTATEAIVDTAAANCLISENVAEMVDKALRARGLKVVWKRALPGKQAAGVGGTTAVTWLAIFPVRVGARVYRLPCSVVAESNIPPLLPIQTLEHMEAVIDVGHNAMYHVGGITALRALPSGHRVFDFIQGLEPDMVPPPSL